MGPIARLPGALDPIEDGSKLALQGDGEVFAGIAGRDDNPVDDLAECVGGFQGVVGMTERFGQTPGSAPKGLGDAGMDVGNVLRGFDQPGVEVFLFAMEG